MKHLSRTLFEIVDGGLVYRDWDVVAEHIYQDIPNGVTFGTTGIALQVIGDALLFTVPQGQRAGLIAADHAFIGGERVDGRFVEVRIYE